MVEVVWSAVTRQTARRPMFDNFLILGQIELTSNCRMHLSSDSFDHTNNYILVQLPIMIRRGCLYAPCTLCSALHAEAGLGGYRVALQIADSEEQVFPNLQPRYGVKTLVKASKPDCLVVASIA
jgi:hypothetical protein